MKFNRLFVPAIFLLFTYVSFAQSDKAVAFTYSNTRVNDSIVMLHFNAAVKPGIKLFAINQNTPDAVASTITYDTSIANKLRDVVIETNVKTEKDSILNADVVIITDSATWQQKVFVASTDSALVKGKINYMVKEGDEYKPGEEDFKFVVKTAKDAASAETASATGNAKNASLLWIFLGAFGGGLLALLTPCVYSMIPVTVSFFTKRSKTKQEGIRNAVYYSLSIIIIFTLLGFLVTVFFGPAALNNLATNWIANLFFFALFLLFGISFLGAFEIELPSSWSNKADSKAGTGNFWGIFFMALTLVLVSFSCTGPIIGNLLVLAAKGSYFGPLVGMFGFSLALALPFALFAFFPGKLNVLGKAGGWLNAVKVTLGFLELALALKFLSNADLVKNWRILDREVFIVLWIVIFLLLGLYLLGKLKFKHDDELPKNDFGIPYLSVTRLFFAIISFSVMVYLVPGLWGAPLKGLSAFLPPMGTQDFNADDLPSNFKLSNLSSGTATTDANGVLPEPVKYADVMKKNEPDVVVNNHMVTYFDYNEALEIARRLKKPLMLDFTGINCINCRKMEGQVWSDPKVMKTLKEDFVIVSLYVDVNDVALPEAEHYFSKDLGKQVTTLGEKNTDMQVSKYGSNSQPYYFFLDKNEQRLIPDGYGYDSNVDKFLALLNKAKEEYKKRTL